MPFALDAVSQAARGAVAALQAYLDAEEAFDLAAIEPLIPEDHCGFGTGGDEIVLGRFKDVNDTHGHLVGDRLLQSLRQRRHRRVPTGRDRRCVAVHAPTRCSTRRSTQDDRVQVDR